MGFVFFLMLSAFSSTAFADEAELRLELFKKLHSQVVALDGQATEIHRLLNLGYRTELESALEGRNAGVENFRLELKSYIKDGVRIATSIQEFFSGFGDKYNWNFFNSYQDGMAILDRQMRVVERLAEITARETGQAVELRRWERLADGNSRLAVLKIEPSGRKVIYTGEKLQQPTVLKVTSSLDSSLIQGTPNRFTGCASLNVARPY